MSCLGIFGLEFEKILSYLIELSDLWFCILQGLEQKKNPKI